MSVYGDKLSKEAMIRMAQAQPVNYPTMGSDMQFGGSAQDPSQIPQQMPQIAAPAPVAMQQLMPQGGGNVVDMRGRPMGGAMGGLPPASDEELRHELSNIAANGQLTAGGAPRSTGAPAAPPLGENSPAALPTGRSGIPHEASARALAQQEIARGTAMEKFSGTGLMQNLKTTIDAEHEGQDADFQTNEINRQMGNEQNAIDDAAVAKAKEQEDQMKAIATRGQMAAEAQMKRVMSAADDASRAEIHNFWQDKSSGARVLGILSQAFAGAANGLAGNPSAPTPLDRVIERDMNMQMANLQQKNRNLENQRGVLRDLYDQTGNAMQATTAMYVAAWKRISLQGAQLKSKFANETADAANEKLQALSQARIADATNKTFDTLRNTSIQQQQHGINILAETERTDSMAGPKESGENAKVFHLAGTTSYVDGRTYDKFKEADEGYRTVMAQANHIKQIATLYKSGKINEAQAFQDYNAARSDLLTAQRKVQGTGAALSDQEFQNLQQALPQLGKSMIPFMSKTFGTDLSSQVDRIMATSSRRFYSHIGNTVKGVNLDPDDAMYGGNVKTYMQEVAAQQAAQQAQAPQ